MEITGFRTDIQRIKIDVDILEALDEIDKLNRIRLRIPSLSWIAQEDGKYVLKQEEESYHGRSWEEIIDEYPSAEVVDYLLTYKKFYDYVRETKYIKEK